MLWAATMSRRVAATTPASPILGLVPDVSTSNRAADAKAAFNSLSPTEQSVACLGVSPDEWKPISFLNNAHYEQLIASNMLDDNLARRIEAYRVVAHADASA